MEKLPQPSKSGKISLEETIHKRRSIRSYAHKTLTKEQISQILWSAQGITEYRYRSAPSAGALYPIEIYFVSSEGFFHYLPEKHSIEKIIDKDIREELAKSCWGQAFIAEAPITIIIAAVYSRVTDHYGNRGIRYVDMEAGHIAQNIHLQAVALDLGSVPVGAFNDQAVIKLLNLPKNCVPIYLIPVGYVK